MSTLMEVRNLRKSYGSVVAVDGVSFTIEGGSCFGLLGPNGAGKTTTVEILEGILPPTSGEVLYQGKPLDEQFTHDAGIMFQNTALQDYITVREALDLFASFYHRTVPAEQLIAQCALEEFLDRDTRKLSGGQKQRLLLAIALINDPVVLFLDEPTTGLDPQARRNFWHLLERIKTDGKTIILTTHYMEEAGLLCDHLVFVDHGKVIAEGKPDELLANQFDDVVLDLPMVEGSLMPVTNSFQTVKAGGDRIEIKTHDLDASVNALLAQNVSLSGMQIRSRDLEDLFLELTGKELRA